MGTQSERNAYANPTLRRERNLRRKSGNNKATSSAAYFYRGNICRPTRYDVLSVAFKLGEINDPRRVPLHRNERIFDGHDCRNVKYLDFRTTFSARVGLTSRRRREAGV